MQGASGSSLVAARKNLNSALSGDIDGAAMGEDLFKLTGVLGGSVGLRRALSDPTREGRVRADLIDRLFSGRISDEAREVARFTVAQRWSRDAHLSVALDLLAVEAFLANAQKHNRLGQVEDELFRFSRIVRGHSELQAAFSDRRATESSKSDLLQTLLSEKVASETLRLTSHAVGARTKRFDRALESYQKLAAQRQEQVTAVVTSASQLSEQQRKRIGAALSKQYGQTVNINLVVDPEVLGGVRVEIGDEVIEGTISDRLAGARRHVTR